MALVLALAFATAAPAQTEQGATIDITHYKISAELLPDSHTLKATAVVTFKALKQTQSAVLEMNGSLTISTVKGPDGKVESWAIEAGAPNAMFRRGWNKNSIPVGIEVVVEGYRAKNGKNIANGRDVLLPDGKKLFVGSSGTGAPRDGRDPTEK